ncbi:uncharacterized protein KY384_004949 [Bacidia gigantensis]|uniref:uncharacterized protein n=1 Tax=Bacidia gigantensis TaxID=2732470 RepID=UPI001D043FA6|nr:uncharacterized protein KY384_004949 [Bacidia gigantensis]KAG8530447.1 hypothetical protein KY384_004949 [Bacidia gigantensis]
MSNPYQSDNDALHFLSTQGWLPLILGDHPSFVEAYTNLLAASATFFALDESSPQKTTYRAVTGALASEEGYSKIPAEKLILTIKTSSHCPSPLLSRVQEAWSLTGAFMSQLCTEIAESLQLSPNVFAPLIDPCITLPAGERTPTLLRMFRYDRPSGPDWKVNAEKHRDLGLLSLVVGHSPGLHVLNSSTGLWVPIEEDDVLPPDARIRSGGLTATLLVGETLAFLSRGKFKAGVHGVVCAPLPSEGGEMGGGAIKVESEQYRYSIVFTLRPAIAPLWTKDFESEITGWFPEGMRSEGTSSDELFTSIREAHYNVNVAPEVREKQRLAQVRQQQKGMGKRAQGQG